MSQEKDKKDTPSKTVYVITQCTDYADVQKVKWTYASAADYLLDFVAKQPPPFGSKEEQEKVHNKFKVWIASLTLEQLKTIKSESENGQRDCTRIMWCSLQDTYKLWIHPMVVED
jgi:hypothetical protein